MDNTHLEKNTSYIASQDLLDAVNIAVTLQKPLLVKGEPGTGKTMLAHAVAETMNKPLFIWNIKSTTKAQDGLYTYDVVQRLYDSQFGENVDDISQYIHYGKMGEAFMADEQVILLIDEIDKADLEFPNDLLWEMDQMEFYVKETHQTIRAKQRPIVIITSNAEKELPDAFLRRCIFHYIEFPDPEQMEKIIHAHFDRIDDELVKQAMDTFYRIRDVKNKRSGHRLSRKRIPSQHPPSCSLISFIFSVITASRFQSANGCFCWKACKKDCTTTPSTAFIFYAARSSSETKRNTIFSMLLLKNIFTICLPNLSCLSLCNISLSKVFKNSN